MPISAEQRETVLQALEDGASLVKACKAADIPSRRHWYEAMAKDQAIADSYARARQLGYESRADDLLDVACDESIEPNSRKVMVSTMQWELSKMHVRYSDKPIQMQASITLAVTKEDEAL